eukprot:CAMPEP_0203762984 /NCGR_PEP_ID=MMETSP0098-20131031/15730_1 /ASSEMBLY_ACC=CAM_ASM_000208 /TAXON_ID=96639 /ORGANISM=" , Strain NY0313808BC1" /LENGTH=903 /DNA_ID=CAMNT_0050657587 /DNA_START=64 /DNA_END=2775 /DNA_ORIENTATION=+
MEFKHSDSDIEEVDRESLFFELVNAVAENKYQVLKTLTKFMCPSEVAQLDPRSGSKSFGLSPLHLCTSKNVCELILKHGPLPVDLLAFGNVTPLMSSVQYPQVLQYLIDNGADVDAEADDGSTALHRAVLENSLASVRLLLEAGAKVNKRDKLGNAPLHSVGDIRVAKCLVEKGAEIDMQNDAGNIPLEEAVSHGRAGRCMEVANYLLDMSHHANRTKTQQLLDVLGQHVLENMTDKLKHGSPSTVIPVRTAGSDGSIDEETMIYETNEKIDAKDKWKSVKKRVLTGKVKLLRLRKRSSTVSENVRLTELKRAAFAKRSFSLLPEDMQTKREFDQTFFELMVRDRPELARRILDKQRVFLFKRHGCSTYSYKLDLVGSPMRVSAAVKEMIRLKRYDLLSHPVTLWHICSKYKVMTRYLLFFEFVACITFTVLIAATYSSTPGHLALWWSALAGGVLQNPSGTMVLRSIRMVSEILMMIWNFRYIFSFLIQWNAAVRLVRCPKKKLKFLIFGRNSLHGDLFLLPHVALIAREYLQVYHSSSTTLSVVASSCSAVAFLVMWQRCFNYGSGLYDTFGLTLTTIKRMTIDTRHYFFVLLLFIFGFSSVMTTMYSNSDVEEFSSLSNSIVTLFFFVFNLDLNAIMDDKIPPRKYAAFCFLGLYMVVVVMTLVNLIIAVMTNSYEDIKQKAKEQCILTRASFVVRFEERMGLFQLFQEYYITRRCGCTKAWLAWEKKNFTGRKVFVKEYPDGVVGVDSCRRVLEFILNERCPPFFLPMVRMYELMNQRPSEDDFSWTRLNFKQGNRYSTKVGEGMTLCQELEQASNGDYGTITPEETFFSNNESLIRLGTFQLHKKFLDREKMQQSMVQKQDRGDSTGNSCGNCTRMIATQEQLLSRLLKIETKLDKLN